MIMLGHYIDQYMQFFFYLAAQYCQLLPVSQAEWSGIQRELSLGNRREQSAGHVATEGRASFRGRGGQRERDAHHTIHQHPSTENLDVHVYNIYYSTLNFLEDC